MTKEPTLSDEEKNLDDIYNIDNLAGMLVYYPNDVKKKISDFMKELEEIVFPDLSEKIFIRKLALKHFGDKLAGKSLVESKE